MYTYMSGYGKEEISVWKGRTITGVAIGIIKEGSFWHARIPGDVANATTYNFPVYFKEMEATNLQQLLTTEPDPAFVKEVIKAGKELEQLGCRAIVGCCGLFANYLPEIAAGLNVPCFLTSLMQIPIISHALKPSQKVGVICGDSRGLSPVALKNCGVDSPSTVVIVGLENMPEMHNLLDVHEGITGTGHWNPGKFEQEIVSLAKQTVSKHPDIGAIVLECSNLPPFAWAIQEAVRLPVFDFTTLINWAYSAVVRRPFVGYI